MEIATLPQTQAKMIYQDFLEWGGEDQHVEWVEGEVIRMSPISNTHQKIGAYLITLLQFYANLRSLGEVRYEPFQMKTGPNLPGRSPDIMFIADENSKRLKKTYLDGPAVISFLNTKQVVFPSIGCSTRFVSRPSFISSARTEYTALCPRKAKANIIVQCCPVSG